MEGELFARDGFGVGDVDVAGGEVDGEWDGGVHRGCLGGEEKWIQSEVVLDACDTTDGDGGGPDGAEGDRGGQMPTGACGGSGDGDKGCCAEFQGEGGVGGVVGGIAE